jgi:hypothetical protein
MLAAMRWRLAANRSARCGGCWVVIFDSSGQNQDKHREACETADHANRFGQRATQAKAADRRRDGRARVERHAATGFAGGAHEPDSGRTQRAM